MQNPEVFFSLASYMPWGASTKVPENVFRLLDNTLRPDLFDEKDPPSRSYTGSTEDVIFWLTKHNSEAWGRYLYFKRKGNDQPYYLCIDWVDLEVEHVRARGDYNYLYGSIKRSDLDVAVKLWSGLCNALCPFHAFLDSRSQYNRRAHKVLRDGTINKTTGWYFKRLPGLFAHNYFGNVYAKIWGQEIINTLSSSLVTKTDKGFFLQAPSGLTFDRDKDQTYSSEDWEVIHTLGEEWFHLPDRPDRDQAPTLEQFLEATFNCSE